MRARISSAFLVKPGLGPLLLSAARPSGPRSYTPEFGAWLAQIVKTRRQVMDLDCKHIDLKTCPERINHTALNPTLFFSFALPPEVPLPGPPAPPVPLDVLSTDVELFEQHCLPFLKKLENFWEEALWLKPTIKTIRWSG